MGLFDSILGSVLGSNSPNQGALGSILGSVLASQGGVGGLVQKMNQAGLGSVVSSWVGNGTNQSVDPGQLGQVLGRDQVNQWSQQTGMPHDQDPVGVVQAPAARRRPDDTERPSATERPGNVSVR